MTDPLPPASSTPAAAEPVEPTPAAAADSKRLKAKRVFGWVCNLLATVLVLFAGLVFSKQVLVWWHGDAALAQANREAMAVVGSDALSTPGRPLDLEFGGWPCVLRREEFSGDRSAARAELRRLCEASIARAAMPSEPARPAELRMLAGLKKQTPFAVLPDGWKLYEQDGPMPLVAAVRFETPPASETAAAGEAHPTSSPAATSTAKPASGAGEVAPVARRVVSWGIGIHLAGTRWTLLLLTTQAKAPIGDEAWAVLLPPGAKRSLSLAAFDQESIVGFVGRGPREAWQQYYDKQLFPAVTSHANWQQVGAVWQQRYETSSATIEVVLAPQPGSDEIQGLVTIRKIHSAPALGEAK